MTQSGPESEPAASACSSGYAASRDGDAAIKVGTLPIVDSMGLECAIGKAYFEDEGVTVTNDDTAAGAMVTTPRRLVTVTSSFLARFAGDADRTDRICRVLGMSPRGPPQQACHQDWRGPAAERGIP